MPRSEFTERTLVLSGKVLAALAVVLIAEGCIGSGVSYRDKDRRLIVVKNNAVLSCCDTVIGGEKQVDSILLKKGLDGRTRSVYFEVLKDSRLSISGADFRLDLASGRLSLRSTNEIVSLTNQYDRCSGLSIVWSGDKQFVVSEMHAGRITYFTGGGGGAHFIWIDVTMNDGQNVHFPVNIDVAANKDAVLLSIERRERCDIVIQENLYEFGTF